MLVFCRMRASEKVTNIQGRILAVWILAAKLPNSDLNFAVIFGWFFSSYVFQGKRPEKIHQKIPRKIHPGLCSEKFPSDFCRSLFLINILRHFAMYPQVSDSACAEDQISLFFLMTKESGSICPGSSLQPPSPCHELRNRNQQCAY